MITKLWTSQFSVINLYLYLTCDYDIFLNILTTFFIQSKLEFESLPQNYKSYSAKIIIIFCINYIQEKKKHYRILINIILCISTKCKQQHSLIYVLFYDYFLVSIAFCWNCIFPVVYIWKHQFLKFLHGILPVKWQLSGSLLSWKQ